MTSSRIEIILGCMFSGKSTELLRRCNRYKAIDQNVLLVNHSDDSRTDNSIKTHRNDKQKATKTDSLLSLLDKSEFLNAKIIGIDEAQFFTDLYDFVLKSEKYNKIIIIAGLDGDYNRKPFGQILDCIPLCDTVEKLTAMDMIDKNGTPGIFTKRIVSNNNQVLVGSTDCYKAVSRKNYLH